MELKNSISGTITHLVTSAAMFCFVGLKTREREKRENKIRHAS